MREGLIKLIINSFCSKLDNIDCITLGGSRALNKGDSLSDTEMYFYFDGEIPNIDQLNSILYPLGAKHKRSKEFLWCEKPWGAHSFFILGNEYFEIGFRTIQDIKMKVRNYFEGDVVAHKDCNDLCLGYLYGGLVYSIKYEKILFNVSDEIYKLKNVVNRFTDELLDNLIKEYYESSKDLIYGKLLNAAKRQDIIFYSALSSKIIRFLIILAFAINNEHFPGDKWNETLLGRLGWSSYEKFIFLIKEQFSTKRSPEELIDNWKLVELLLKIIENEL